MGSKLLGLPWPMRQKLEAAVDATEDLNTAADSASDSADAADASATAAAASASDASDSAIAAASSASDFSDLMAIQPEIAHTPTAQNVVDALVALGLVTQAGA